MPTATERFTDLAYQQDAETVYDLVIDTDNADLALTDGLESAIFVSLFSDRRAREDEVADIMRRRGWIGDLFAEVRDDRHGSGLWLYEQRRMTPEVQAGIETEALQALMWMQQEGLASTIATTSGLVPARRRLELRVDIAVPQGGTTSRAYALADATRSGALARH